MTRHKHFWAPLPVRIITGYGLIFAGYYTLFDEAGRTGFANLIEALGLPSLFASLLPWVEFIGGIGIVFGAFTVFFALINVVAIGLPALVAFANGNTPIPFPDAYGLPAYAAPQYGESIMLIAGLLALVIGGAGSFSIDAFRALRKARNKPLTLVVPVKAGQTGALVRVLEEINDNLYDNPYIRFADDTATHFLRMLIITTPEKGDRLVFAATHHGDRKTYVDQLLELWPGLDAVWSKCEGYEGRDKFHQFVKKYFVPSPYWFTAFPYETVESIRNKVAIREELEKVLDFKGVNEYMDNPGLKPLVDRLQQVSRPSALVLLDRWLKKSRENTVHFLRSMFLAFALRATKIYARLGESSDFPRMVDAVSDVEEHKKYLEHVDALEANETSFQQNQFTVFFPIKPSLYRRWRLRLALFFGGYLAGYGYPEGELTGVFTIHFLHWIIIDNDQYGMVMSNYDGSWENYLGDFADKLNYGLDALFNNCGGYPASGLNDLESWAKWIRGAQCLVPLYYSAYPRNTAIHIARDKQVAELVAHNFFEEDLLSLLSKLQ